MTTIVILALGVALVALVLAVAELRHAKDEAAAHREDIQRLLNRLEAKSLAEFTGAEHALYADPLQDPPPDGYLRDDTGLIEEPYYRDDRLA